MIVTVHHQYNDVSNQQYATTFPFINLFKSALHVSGDKFSQLQEHFLSVYTDKGAPEDGRICRPKRVGLI
jgi:hypothetical protein